MPNRAHMRARAHMLSRAHVMSSYRSFAFLPGRSTSRARPIVWPSGQGVEFGHMRSPFRDVLRRVSAVCLRHGDKNLQFFRDGDEVAMTVLEPAGPISFVADSPQAPGIVGIIADSAAAPEELTRRVARILGARFTVNWTFEDALTD